MVMPIGKYAGTPVEQLPTDYIRWAVENLGANLDNPTVEALMDEFNRRNGVFGFENHVADPKASLEGKDVQKAGLIALKNAWQQANEQFEKTTGHALPACQIAFRTNKDILGTWYPGLRLITISNYWILPRKVLQSVIVHEMCHQYITDMKIHDNAPHGQQWRKIAALMENATGLRIQKTVRPKGFVANSQRRADPNHLLFYDEN